MRVILVIPDPPPVRTVPGRAADRQSPNALPLASAGLSLVRSEPAAFPAEFSRINVVFGSAQPDTDQLGYQPEQAIIEVLADFGAIIEPEGWSMRSTQDPAADFYVVTLLVVDKEPN